MKTSCSGYGLPTSFLSSNLTPIGEIATEAPTVTSISPDEGYETVETSVTISGSGFTNTRRVLISEDGTSGNVRDLVVVNDTEITCKVPPRYATFGYTESVYIDTPGGRVVLADAWTYLPGAPAVLTSIDKDIADTSGGDTIVATGSGFTGATAADVLFGATPAASITVNSDTQITAVTPAKTAGTYNVSVKGSTLTNAIEFWSPAELAPTLFYEANFAVGGGTASWTPRSKTLAGTGVASRAAASGPTASSGYPDFGTASRLDITGETWTSIIGSSGHTFLAVIEVDAIYSTHPNLYQGDAIITSAGLYQGLYLGGPNKDLATIFLWPSSANYASADLGTDPVTGRFVIAAKWAGVGNALKITKDGSSWVTGNTPAGVAGGLTEQPIIGSAGYDGRIKTLIMDDAVWSDANVAKFYRWAAARHP